MSRVDTDKLLNDNPVYDVVERYIRLKKDGPHYRGVCPFHDDTAASLTITPGKNLAKCFACGWSGDAIAFVMEYTGKSFRDACTEIETASTSQGTAVKKVIEKVTRVEWRQIRPEHYPARGEVSHYRHGAPSMGWAYHDVDGNIMGYIFRFNLANGEKEVMPYIFATDGINKGWRWQGFDRPRPLYTLHKLKANPKATVIVVEGEKTAEAAQKLFPDAVVTTWQGGARAIKYTDWTPLYGRRVVLWPDNDISGNNAMWDIFDLIKNEAELVRWVWNPEDAPKHWDLADSSWSPEEAQAYARVHMLEVPERTEMIEEAPYIPEAEVETGENITEDPDSVVPDQPAHHDPTPEEVQEQHFHEEPPFSNPPLPANNKNLNDDYHFKFLGYSKDGDTLKHYFFTNGSQTILALSAPSMSLNNLIQMAPLNYWEMNFQGAKGLSLPAAVNWLVNTSVTKGTFSVRHVRGRGAWFDGKDCVIHAGDHLVINGKRETLKGHKSRYVYESGEPMPLALENPLSNQDANKIMEIVRLLNWERDISSYLLVGWCIIAPICGALKWRPHIWLTGAAGTGKSWVFRNIVRRLMEGVALPVQGETSEAGIRQTLGHDALPIIFDEAEGEDKRAVERMSAVMGLMRSASSDDGGMITKGSAGGSAISYKIRSCFAFASISVQVSQQSDRTRVTVLGLKKNDSAEGSERWKQLQEQYLKVVTDEYVKRLQARTIALLPVIMENTRTFSAAAAIVIGEQRAGDQLGALLAGAFSVFSNKVIGLEEAIEWLKSRDWTEEKALDKSRDEMALLAHLMEQMTTVETLQSKYDRNVGEIVAVAAGAHEDAFLPIEAQARLKRLGIKVEQGMLIISNTADWIKSRLDRTPWSRNHNKILLRLEGANSMETIRFGSGIQTRAVAIPLSVVIHDYGEPPF